MAGMTAIGLDYAAAGFVKIGHVSMTKDMDVLHYPVGQSPVTFNDIEAAQIAWVYFENNTQFETGFVNSVSTFPSTTMWDQGSYILAAVSAMRLGIITETEFNTRISKLLNSFKNLVLFDGYLPNKAYNTQTLERVTYENQVTNVGIGWSAIDMGRLLLALRVLEKHAPNFAKDVNDVISSWDLNALTDNGMLTGTSMENDIPQFYQEGRFGYEQYAARGAALWGLDTLSAMSAKDIVTWQSVEGVDVPSDNRTHRIFNAITPTLSEPHFLTALELGMDNETRLFADRILRAQEKRSKDTGTLTFVSEDHINQSPHFVYSSVFGNEKPWAVLSEDGKHHPDLRTLSTKTVFAWDALYRIDYTSEGRDFIERFSDAEQGWPAGVYEKDGQVNDIFTLNTNAVVLEAVHYMLFGPLWDGEKDGRRTETKVP